jgi:rhamnosyltransferase
MDQIDNKKDNDRIAVLMATYNGEQFVRMQIESLLAQTMTGWTLYINDDGSTDATPDIINEYAAKYDNIVVMGREGGMGACHNFLGMLCTVEAEYYFLCDQDDRWAPDKMEKEMKIMRETEKHGKETPVIVHCDLRVVDRQMNLIHESFNRYAGVYPHLLNRFDHSVEPYITGCTMLLNRAAHDAVVYPATLATMHDAWITLCTLKAGGMTILIDEPLVDYRQHGSNTLGARDIKKVGLAYRFRRLRKILRDKRRHYAMLRFLGYGSPWKYIKEKIRYKYLISKDA